MRHLFRHLCYDAVVQRNVWLLVFTLMLALTVVGTLVTAIVMASIRDPSGALRIFGFIGAAAAVALLLRYVIVRVGETEMATKKLREMCDE